MIDNNTNVPPKQMLNIKILGAICPYFIAWYTKN